MGQLYEERQVSTGSLYAVGLWALSAAFTMAAAYMWFEHQRMGALMLFGITAHQLACAAVVVHVRGYAARTCRLIRLTAGQVSQPSERLRAL